MRLLNVGEANFSSRLASFDVMQCPVCGTAFMSPWPTQEDIEELYVRDGVFSQPVENPNLAHPLAPVLERYYAKCGQDLRFIARNCLSAVRSRSGTVSILDVGCSTGALMLEFARQSPGATVTGIDIDPGAKLKAPHEVRDRIRVGEFVHHSFAEQEFDLVSMRFVLEHLLRPMDYLTKAASLLRPGGCLFLALPDHTSPQARKLGPDWELMNDPRRKVGHLSWYSPQSVATIASRLGLEIVSVRHRGEMIWHFPDRAASILRQIFGTEPVRGRFIKSYPLRLLYATVFDGLLSEMLDVGDHLYAILRRPQ